MDEDAFLRKLLENPADDVARLVYADWLEERDTDEAKRKAEYLRATVQLLTGELTKSQRKKLRNRLVTIGGDFETDWLSVVRRSKVENCGDERKQFLGETGPRVSLAMFAFECDRRWDEMTSTDADNVRFCSKCQESVFYCDTIDAAREHAIAGHCVAVDHRVERHPGDLARDASVTAGLFFPISYQRIGLPEPEPEEPLRIRREREAEARDRRNREESE
jgi:uncharacterized protein (TIGR02996 family)